MGTQNARGARETRFVAQLGGHVLTPGDDLTCPLEQKTLVGKGCDTQPIHEFLRWHGVGHAKRIWLRGASPTLDCAVFLQGKSATVACAHLDAASKIRWRCVSAAAAGRGTSEVREAPVLVTYQGERGGGRDIDYRARRALGQDTPRVPRDHDPIVAQACADKGARIH